jgi:two-component system sensor histidine kinase/response regulator
VSGAAEPCDQASILMVDDNPVNLKVLTSMLRQSGWRPRPVTSGRLGLQAAQSDPPDLVLLDVNMPDMSGYELCARMKADPRLAEIPVIFVSALDDTPDKVRGFQVGGVDYITKPFQIDEVRARVSTHLELRRQRRELEGGLEQLRESERLRDNLVHMIVHDLRSPLSAISIYLEMFAEEARQKLGRQTQLDIASATHAARTMVRLINGILDVSKMESERMTLDLRECDLVHVIGRSLGDFESLVGERQIAFEHPSPPAWVVADEEIVVRIVQNLLANALRLTPAGGSIRVGIEVEAAHTRVFVADTGPGIPASLHAKVFEKFATLDTATLPHRQTTGLGLTFCRMAVEAHGGRIGVESQPGQGSTFWFTLPKRPLPDDSAFTDRT